MDKQVKYPIVVSADQRMKSSDGIRVPNVCFVPKLGKSPPRRGQQEGLFHSEKDLQGRKRSWGPQPGRGGLDGGGGAGCGAGRGRGGREAQRGG